VSWSTTYDAGARRRSSFGRDERCHVSFSSSSNSIIYFHYDFIMLLLCFYYAFIMLSLCFFRYEINKGFFLGKLSKHFTI